MTLSQVLSRRRFLLGAAGAAATRAALRAVPAGAAGTAPGAPRAVAFDLSVSAARFERDDAGRHVSAVLAAPGRFDLAGARWRGGRGGRGGPEDPRVELRGRRRGGAWSPWTAAPLLHGHAPDGGRAAPGTDGVWFGGADLVQIRLSAPLEGLRLHFVNASGTATASARAASRAWRRRRAQAAARPTAEAAGAAPAINPRKAWDPHDQCHPREKPLYGAVALAFVHHTVSANDYAPEDSAGIVLSVGLYHRNTNGWNDIGYNFLVDRYGQVFEGRAGGVTKAVTGAHAQGFNYTSTGVANIGTFDAVGQTAKGLAVLSKLIAWKLALHGTPRAGTVRVVSEGGATNRYPSGTPVTLHRVSGHRDVDATDCPGEDLYAELPRLRAMVQGRQSSQAATSVTLLPPAAPVRYGRRSTLRGRVLVAGRPPLGGSVVDVQTVDGAIAETVASMPTAADGTFALTLPLKVSTTLRALFDPGTGAKVLVSDNVLAAVAPALTLAAARPHVKTGRSATLTIGSRPTTRPLTLVVQRRVRGSWRTVVRRTLRTRATHASVKLPHAGSYRVRVGWAGSSVRAAAHSPWLALRASGAGPGGAGAG
jgi:hypothetical protein